MATTTTAPRVAKTLVTLNIKPCEAETDMSALETSVRAITKDGLIWGNSKLIDIAYGIENLQINLVIEDKVDLTELEEEIGGMEELVQSVDVVGMQKL